MLVHPAGLVPYGAANEAMHDLAHRRAGDETPDVLVLLEHPPTYTAGRRSDPAHVLWTEDRIRAAGAELHHIDRGGSLTFHGPGQLVGYPILKLGSRLEVIEHLRRMEEIVIRAGADIGVGLGRDPKQTGVWAGDKKVAAIGVRLTAGRVTLHGFGLNCSTDLSWFDAIVPCGLADRGVTSLSELAGRTITTEEIAPLVEHHFEDTFGRTLEPAPASLATSSHAARRSAAV